MLDSIEKKRSRSCEKRQHRTRGPESERLFALLATLDHPDPAFANRTLCRRRLVRATHRRRPLAPSPPQGTWMCSTKNTRSSGLEMLKGLENLALPGALSTRRSRYIWRCRDRIGPPSRAQVNQEQRNLPGSPVFRSACQKC